MANTHKFIVKNGLRAQNVEFTDSHSGSNQISLNMLNSDTLNFEGDAGSLFSIADDLTGSVFTVGDISGIPIVDVNGDTHNITMAQFDGKVMIGGTDSGSTDSDVLNVTGNVKATAYYGDGSNLTGISGGGGSTAADDIATGDAAITLKTTSGNIDITTTASDQDIRFNGNDGGSVITALTLDMSDAGKAVFNNGVKGAAFPISSTNGGIDIAAVGGSTTITCDTGATNVNGTGGVTIQHSGSTKIATTSTGVSVTGTVNADSATFAIATISHISNAPLFLNHGGNEGGEITLQKAPNSNLDNGTYNRTVIDQNIDKLRFFTNGSARGAHLNLANMDSNTAGSNNIITEQTSHTFTKVHNFRNDIRFDSAGGILFDVSDKALEFGDNYKASFGTGADLKIYHDGSNSLIRDDGSGSLYFSVNGSTIFLRNASAGEDLAKFISNGAVELYHDNSKKFETTSTGATITGTTTTGGLFSNGDIGNNQSAKGVYAGLSTAGDAQIALVGDNTDVSPQIDFCHDVSIDYDARIILDNTGNRLKIVSHGNESMAHFNADGSAELYHDNSKKLETTSTGVSVTGLLSATTKSFDIEHPTKNGKRLRYGSLEGPENGVYVRGRIKGINKIKLPDYWTGLVDEETITVNITPIGSEQCLFVEDIQSSEITIGGGQDIDCFYTVYGERKDVDKLKVEYES